jgi:glucosamine-phosphate N-acetyltransferase
MSLIRNITLDDYEAYTNLISQLASHFEKYDYKVYKHLIEKLPQYYHIFMYELEGKVIGTVKILIEQKWYSEKCYLAHIEDVVIDKLYRGQGYGKALMESVLQFCKDQHCYKVVLYCSDRNVPFYEKTGFIREGTFLCKRF